MKINRSGNKLEIIVPVNKYWNHLFVFGAASIVICVLILLVIIKAIVTLNLSAPPEVYGLLLLGPIFICYSLWLLIGMEKLVFDEDVVEYIRTNGIISSRKKFELKKIKNLKPIEKQFKTDGFLDTKRESIKETQRAFPFWLKMGKIAFQYEQKDLTILNGLDNKEMIEVSVIINEEIERSRCQSNNLNKAL